MEKVIAEQKSRLEVDGLKAEVKFGIWSLFRRGELQENRGSNWKGGHTGSHLMGIFFTNHDSEMEYLIYTLMGIDMALCALVSGLLWTKRYEIVQGGVRNMLLG